jgi:GNAT superfamily N-acetyltransferase
MTIEPMPAYDVRVLRPDEVDWLETAFNRDWPWPRPRGFVANLIDTHTHLVAQFADATYLGHCRISTSPLHPPFRDAGIAEVQDLNVMPPFRRRGVASALLDLAESIVRATSDVIGIGVGLYNDYGPAQRLYSRRGYVLDGTGAWWNHQPVVGGDTVVADDDLTLYFTKTLR